MSLYPKYWMVLRDPPFTNGNVGLQYAPRFVHESRESAEKEAERLALKTGEPFLILEGVAWVHPRKADLAGLPSTVPAYQQLPIEAPAASS
ncbi:hypothetical protein EDC30_109140 [Paucimonas lemoignei]|uniref:Uncharacterized protein n=1 Tax=Paucimonas lemoignei TaxID=29443 RepID=A0A4R3HUJ0_PAULE|nr:hypothetical protein [Paucimonas lemoignei]TCS35841.1 hypothetical protein EDC30_109140 [Paucimonas lemoignei]